MDWIRANFGQVEIVPTEIYAEYEALQAINPNMRSNGRGEQAALEVLAYEVASHPELQALLLLEDSDIRSREFVRLLPERVTALSTGDLLHELESACRIQSSDQILDEAAARGSQHRKAEANDCGRACASAASRTIVTTE
ncbi:hypothetical protein [Roseiarcus sp.]|uniref:hypothetical protein n=1 Tax=Roseiarcus sp. TaxID=1969460 RepID=UPI003F994453